MDASNMTNLQNRLQNLKGGTKVGQFLLIGLFGLFTIAGIAALFSGQIVTGLILTGIFGLVMVVFIRAIPKEKRAAEESWKRLTPEEIARIDMDSLTSPALGNALITRDAIVMKTPQGAKALPAKDILWVYGKQVTQKLYGVIPTSKSYSIQVVSRSGENTALPAPNAQKNRKTENPLSQDINTIGNVLRMMYPGIVFGYNQQIEALAQRNIAQLAQIVDERNAGRR